MSDVAVIIAGSLRDSVVQILSVVEPPVGKTHDYYLVHVFNASITKRMIVSGRHLKSVRLSSRAHIDCRDNVSVNLLDDFESAEVCFAEEVDSASSIVSGRKKKIRK